MARKRMISPEFFTDPDLSELSVAERYFYFGLICNADDEGRFEASAKNLKRIVFGADDDITAHQVDTMLLNIAVQMRSFKLYEVDNRRYGCFLRWHDWQKPPKPSPSTLPEYSESSSVMVTNQFGNGSVALPTKERKKEERKKEGSTPPSSTDEPDASSSGECRWCAKPSTATKGVQYLFREMHAAYLAKTGQHSTITPGKDGNLLGQLLGSAKTEADIMATYHGYLNSEDEFMHKRGFDIATFCGHYDGIAMALKEGHAHGAKTGGNGHDKDKQYQFAGMTRIETPAAIVWVEAKDVDYFRTTNSAGQAKEIERIRKLDPGRVQLR